MFGKAEQHYTDLMKKKKIVEADKAKIEAAIAALDEKKNDALRRTWQQVNKDFGSIFSTLLPGTSARLAPPEGRPVQEGLEVGGGGVRLGRGGRVQRADARHCGQVNVAFGDVWKESLTELSGGQRSLVALSLVLAMLLFKPAPM